MVSEQGSRCFQTSFYTVDDHFLNEHSTECWRHLLKSTVSQLGLGGLVSTEKSVGIHCARVSFFMFRPTLSDHITQASAVGLSAQSCNVKVATRGLANPSDRNSLYFFQSGEGIGKSGDSFALRLKPL